MLLYTELHCAAHRRGFPGETVNTVLGAINLVDLARSDLMYAAALPGKLRSPDAIHLAAAIRLQSDLMVAYDAELLAAAVDAGINVLSPWSFCPDNPLKGPSATFQAELKGEALDGRIMLFVGPAHEQTDREPEILVNDFPGTGKEAVVFHAMTLGPKFKRFREESQP